MRMTVALAIAAAMLGGCNRQEPAGDQNVAIDINQADPSDIEAVPSDETSAAPADLNNGAGNSDVNASTNAY